MTLRANERMNHPNSSGGTTHKHYTDVGVRICDLKDCATSPNTSIKLDPKKKAPRTAVSSALKMEPWKAKPPLEKEQYYCSHCEVTSYNRENFESHLKGKRHNYNIRNQENLNKNDSRPPNGGVFSLPERPWDQPPPHYWNRQRPDYSWNSSYHDPIRPPNFRADRARADRAPYNRPRPPSSSRKHSFNHPPSGPSYIPPAPPPPQFSHHQPLVAAPPPSSSKPPPPASDIEPKVDNLLNTLRYSSQKPATPPRQQQEKQQSKTEEQKKEASETFKKVPTEIITTQEANENSKKETKENSKKEMKENLKNEAKENLKIEAKENLKNEVKENPKKEVKETVGKEKEKERKTTSTKERTELVIVLSDDSEGEAPNPTQDAPAISLKGHKLDNMNITIQNEAQRKVQVGSAAKGPEASKRSGSPNVKQLCDSKLMKTPKVLLDRLVDIPQKTLNSSCLQSETAFSKNPQVPPDVPKAAGSSNPTKEPDNPTQKKPQVLEEEKSRSSAPSKSGENPPSAAKPQKKSDHSTPKQSTAASASIEEPAPESGELSEIEKFIAGVRYDKKRLCNLINNKGSRKEQLLLETVMNERRDSFRPSQRLVSEVSASDLPRNVFSGVLKELAQESKNALKRIAPESTDTDVPTPTVKREPMEFEETSSPSSSTSAVSEAATESELIAPAQIKKEPETPLASSLPQQPSDTERNRQFFMSKLGSRASPSPPQSEEPPVPTLPAMLPLQPTSPLPSISDLQEDRTALFGQLMEISRKENHLHIQACTVHNLIDQITKLQQTCHSRLAQIREEEMKLSTKRREILEKLNGTHLQLPPALESSGLLDTQTLVEQLWANMPPVISTESAVAGPTTAAAPAKRKRKPPAKKNTRPPTSPASGAAIQDQADANPTLSSAVPAEASMSSAQSKGGKRKQPFDDQVYEEVAAKLQALDSPGPSSRPKKVVPHPQQKTLIQCLNAPCLDQQRNREEEQNSVVFHKERVFNKGITCIKVHHGSVYVGGIESYVLRISLAATLDRTEYRSHTKQVTGIAVTDTHVFTISLDCLVRKFNAKSGRLEDTHNLVNPIICLAHNWNMLYLGLNNGMVVPYDIENNRCLDALHCSEKAVCQLVTTRAGAQHLLCVACLDSQVTIWDLSSGLLLRCMEGPVEPPCLLLVLGTQLLSSSSPSKLLHVHNMENGESIRKVKWFAKCTGLALIRNSFLAAAFNKGKVNFYRQSNFAYYCETYGADRDGITCLEVHGNFVFTGNQNGWLDALYFRDDIGPTPCLNGHCGSKFFLLRDFLHHFNQQHFFKIVAKTEKCTWRTCKTKWGAEVTLKEKQDHIVSHISLS